MSGATSSSSGRSSSSGSNRSPYNNTLREIYKSLKNAHNKKLPETEFLQDMLKKAEKIRFLFDVLINIFLVSKKARLATLIETANFQMSSPLFLKIITEFVAYYDLDYQRETPEEQEYSRYFVYRKGSFVEVPNKTDEEIGKALEMYCAGSEYYNSREQRIIGDIIETVTNSQIYAEVCIGSKKTLGLLKSLQDKVKLYNETCQSNNLPYSFVYKINIDDGTAIRIRNMMENDIRYMTSHIEDYNNDLWNTFNEKTVKMIMTVMKNAIHSKEEWIKYKRVLLTIYYVAIYEELLDRAPPRKLQSVIEKLLHDPNMLEKKPIEYLQYIRDTLFDTEHIMYDVILRAMPYLNSFLQVAFV